MDIFAAIVKDLRADTQLITKVTADKIFKGWAVAGTSPNYLNVYPVASGINNELPVDFPQFQFSAFSKSLDDAMAIKKRVCDKYKGFKGQIQGVSVIYSALEGEAYDYEESTCLHHAAVFIKFILEV